MNRIPFQSSFDGKKLGNRAVLLIKSRKSKKVSPLGNSDLKVDCSGLNFGIGIGALTLSTETEIELYCRKVQPRFLRQIIL